MPSTSSLRSKIEIPFALQRITPISKQRNGHENGSQESTRSQNPNNGTVRKRQEYVQAVFQCLTIQ